MMAQEEECENTLLLLSQTRLVLAEQQTKLMQAEEQAREQAEEQATDAASAPLKHQQQLNRAQEVVQQP